MNFGNFARLEDSVGHSRECRTYIQSNYQCTGITTCMGRGCQFLYLNKTATQHTVWFTGIRRRLHARSETGVSFDLGWRMENIKVRLKKHSGEI
jgi:hypothetical protein